MRGLSIVLPTYNERENLPILLKRISTACSSLKYEVIIVDDNSPDGTFELAKKLSKRNKQVRAFLREKKKGLASAIYYGVKKSKYSFVCVMDADLQHPPELITKMYTAIEKHRADIVIASRFVKGSKIKGLSFRRVKMSQLAIFIIHLLFPFSSKVKDPLSGFFLFRKSLLKSLKLRLRGFKFLLELLIRTKAKRVKEVPLFLKRESMERAS